MSDNNNIVSAITGGLGGIINAGVNIANSINQNKISQQNLKLQQEQFEYQKRLQQQLFEREDNAIQRQVADYEKAGFNRLLALGGSGANAGGIVPTTAPQQEQIDFSKNGATLNEAMNQVYNMISMSMNLASSKIQQEILEKEKNKKDEEIREIQSRTELNYAKAQESGQNVVESKHRTPTYSQQIEESRAKTQKEYAMLTEIDRKVKLLESQYKLTEKQRKQINHMIAQGYIREANDLLSTLVYGLGSGTGFMLIKKFMKI